MPSVSRTKPSEVCRTRTAASRRPCTFGNAAVIHELSSRVLTSLVMRPLRKGTASVPLMLIRPRDERSMSPAPPSRTAVYSVTDIHSGPDFSLWFGVEIVAQTSVCDSRKNHRLKSVPLLRLFDYSNLAGGAVV